MENRIHNLVILGAIASTLFWGLIYFLIVHFDAFIVLPPFESFLVLVVLLVTHPLIGKLWSLLVEFMCDEIDEVYGLAEFDQWGGWPPWKRMIFAAWWPIAGPVGVIVTGIGLLYGAMYKGLFK